MGSEGVSSMPPLYSTPESGRHLQGGLHSRGEGTPGERAEEMMAAIGRLLRRG
jgi:hypothetical protein